MKLPPYAKALAQARGKGMVPVLRTGWFVVALGWGVHKRIPDETRWPRVVLPLDVAVQDYDLRPLAGLDLLLVYDRSDSARVAEVAACLSEIKPRSMTSCPIDSVGGDWCYWHEPGMTMARSAAHG